MTHSEAIRRLIRIWQALPSDAPKPFGKAVGEVYRELKESIEKREGLDGSVKETVSKELGDMADKHENKKVWPVS
jgi:hypothetical protein